MSYNIINYRGLIKQMENIMDEHEIVELAGRAHVSPITLHRNGITEDATPDEICEKRRALADRYEMESAEKMLAVRVLRAGCE